MPERLSSAASRLMEQPEHQLYFSALGLWKITIKRGLGRTDFIVDPPLLHRGLIEDGYAELAVKISHISYRQYALRQQCKRSLRLTAVLETNSQEVGGVVSNSPWLMSNVVRFC